MKRAILIFSLFLFVFFGEYFAYSEQTYVVPTEKQLKQLEALPDEGPVVMLNLVKLKPKVGLESLVKYWLGATKLVEKFGGKLIYFGMYEMSLIGEEKWDAVALVMYPSREAFLKMYWSKEYQDIAPYRNQELLDSRLWASKPVLY
jgi:uncharacterized protein (DUF1330 family)